MEESNQGSGSKKIYLAIIALLLLINGVAGYLLFNENKQKEEKIQEVQKKDTEFKDLSQQFDAAKQELESMKGKNAELDSIVNARQAAIEKVQNELRAAQSRGNLTAAEVKKYKDLVAKMESDNADLQKKIQELTSKNEELTAKNLEVTKSLEAEKSTTAALSEDKKNLSKKVELGSLLQLQNLKIEGEHKRKSGKEVAKTSAKKIDYLKITFETGENKVLEKGPLALYVRIINPKGETMAVADQGSGTLKLADGGGDVQYSKKVELDWDQTSKKVSMDWSENIKVPGTFKVEVYQSGYLVGKGSVDLK
jgi:myosin heavy subunit